MFCMFNWWKSRALANYRMLCSPSKSTISKQKKKQIWKKCLVLRWKCVASFYFSAVKLFSVHCVCIVCGATCCGPNECTLCAGIQSHSITTFCNTKFPVKWCTRIIDILSYIFFFFFFFSEHCNARIYTLQGVEWVFDLRQSLKCTHTQIQIHKHLKQK